MVIGKVGSLDVVELSDKWRPAGSRLEDTALSVQSSAGDYLGERGGIHQQKNTIDLRVLPGWQREDIVRAELTMRNRGDDIQLKGTLDEYCFEWVQWWFWSKRHNICWRSKGSLGLGPFLWGGCVDRSMGIWRKLTPALSSGSGELCCCGIIAVVFSAVVLLLAAKWVLICCWTSRRCSLWSVRCSFCWSRFSQGQLVWIKWWLL